MSVLQTRLVGRRLVCGDIHLFAFERPSGYSYQPGQYTALTLRPADGPSTKPFSLCSCPDDERLEISTRLGASAFKRALDSLRLGDAVGIARPAGRFVLSEPPPALVFLVGGVGITPVRSILRSRALRGLPLDAILLYGNRGPGCVPFRDELEELAVDGLRIIHVFENAGAEWRGERGFITAAMVRRLVPDHAVRLFATAGPPAMVEAMERVLDDLGVASERRMVERFVARQSTQPTHEE